MRIEKARSFDVSCVCRDLIRALEASLRLLREEGAGALFAAWRACDYLTGRRICVSTSDGPVSGVYDGIEADGRLRLCDNSGAVRLFWSGDVSIEGRTVWR
jgi:BirA family biotin operon repressor/biotin-[acetyl-CoA-carboxylase] ligase